MNGINFLKELYQMRNNKKGDLKSPFFFLETLTYNSITHKNKSYVIKEKSKNSLQRLLP